MQQLNMWVPARHLLMLILQGMQVISLLNRLTNLFLIAILLQLIAPIQFYLICYKFFVQNFFKYALNDSNFFLPHSEIIYFISKPLNNIERLQVMLFWNFIQFLQNYFQKSESDGFTTQVGFLSMLHKSCINESMEFPTN